MTTPSLFASWDPNILPPPVEEGEIATYTRWTTYRFTHPPGGTMTLNGDQHGQTGTKPTGSEAVNWSPPYYTGSVYLDEAELRAIPGAEEFFNALVAVLNDKLLAQQTPASPGMP